jgi:hypothetical protein
VVSLFVGAGWMLWTDGPRWVDVAPGGLISVMVLLAAVGLTFTGRYPHAIHDFVLGINRWVFRVPAYALLMTAQYPPFRLDMGAEEPPPGAMAKADREGGFWTTPGASTPTRSPHI